MVLSNIHLVNFRCFEDLAVEQLHPHLNVVVGLNGLGKSSLLNGISTVVRLSVDYLFVDIGSEDAVPYLSGLDPRDIRFWSTGSNRGVRFERAEFASLEGTYDFEGRSRPLEAKLSKSGLSYKSEDLASDYRGDMTVRSLPVYAFYKSQRDWRKDSASATDAVESRQSRFDAYSHSDDASSDSLWFRKWLISKALERLQAANEGGQQFDEIDSDELGQMVLALRRFGLGVRGLRYDLKEKEPLVQWEDSEGCEWTPFYALSDGQQSLIGMVADIARRASLLNPHLGAHAIDESPGIILIDEIDLHLHPDWQRKAIRGLTKAFPKMQFFVTTHSPIVVSEVDPSSLLLLDFSGGSRVVRRSNQSIGLDSSYILKHILGSESRPETSRAKLAKIEGLIEEGDLATALEQVGELREFLRGTDPDLAGLEASIHRLESLACEID